jgi:hypothetical protein
LQFYYVLYSSEIFINKLLTISINCLNLIYIKNKSDNFPIDLAIFIKLRDYVLYIYIKFYIQMDNIKIVTQSRPFEINANKSNNHTRNTFPIILKLDDDLLFSS